MDKEVLFGKTLDELRRKAALQGGYIDKNEILEMLAPLELDEEKTGLVFDYLKGRGIRFEINVSDNAIPADDIALENGVTPSENEAVLSEFALDEIDTDYLKAYMDGLDELPEYTDGEKTAFIISAMAGEGAAKEKLINS